MPRFHNGKNRRCSGPLEARGKRDDRRGKALPLDGVSYRRPGCAWRLGEDEGVGVALATDGGGGAVAGVNYGVVGELEKYEQMFGKERGRLAVSLDRITNALVLVPFQLFGPNDGLSI